MVKLNKPQKSNSLLVECYSGEGGVAPIAGTSNMGSSTEKQHQGGGGPGYANVPNQTPSPFAPYLQKALEAQAAADQAKGPSKK